MPSYLLEVAHLFGERRVHERTYIDAEDRQKVKYWYHRHFKEFGHKPGWATSTHTIDIGGGEVVEIEAIELLNGAKAAHASELLPHFPKW